ncbi:MAG: hypothetical protein M3442_12475, partial [Chloroflexota bacterium]|nr:hypothetical protein [Chloroflexota bacterium]
MVATSPARAPAVPQDVQRERLRKVLLHEQRTGCLDRAAVGGLERFVRQLQASLGEGGLPWLSRSASALQGYAGFSPEARRAVIARLLAQLDQPPLPQGQEASRPLDGVSQTGLSKGPDEPLSPEPTAAVPVRLASPAAPLRPSGRATPTLSPQAAVGELPGVGPKAVVALERLGIYSIKDLLYHFPRRHLDRRSVT